MDLGLKTARRTHQVVLSCWSTDNANQLGGPPDPTSHDPGGDRNATVKHHGQNPFFAAEF